MVKQIPHETSGRPLASLIFNPDGLGRTLSPRHRQIRKRPHQNYKLIEYSQRVDVIYDSLVHGMAPHDIADKHTLNYNTVRFIINNFKMHNRVNPKKKKSGYVKRSKN